MKIFLLLFVIHSSLLLSSHCNAQEIVGEILDFKSGEPIAFVNIGVVGKNIGTVSDENGKFSLNVSGALDEDVLRFSFVGYEPYQVVLQSMRSQGLISPVLLKEQAVKMKEVLVTSKRLIPRIMGVPKKKCYPIPFYKNVISNVPFPQEGYRHEIGTLFKNDQPVYLDSVQFNFSDYSIDTLDLRVNLYAYQNDQFVNVLQQPIYLHLTDLKSILSPVIDLSPLTLSFEGDFLVTIENYKRVENNSCGLLANFKAIGKEYPTYYRSNSQSEWQNLTHKSRNFGLSFVAFVKR